MPDLRWSDPVTADSQGMLLIDYTGPKTKVLWEVVKLNFLIFLYRLSQKKSGKLNNFPAWVVYIFYE